MNATNSFEKKDKFKIINNLVYGKSCRNIRKHKYLSHVKKGKKQ